MSILILLISAIILASSLIGPLANHCTPFVTPFSLLVYGPHPSGYYVLVMLILALGLGLLLRSWQFRDNVTGALCLVMVVMSVLLLGCPNGKQGHDAAALVIMIVIGMLGIHMARQLDDGRCTMAAYLGFSGVSVIPSGNLICIGLAEHLLMFSTLTLVNLWVLGTSQLSRYEQPRSIGALSPGALGGIFWSGFGLALLFLSGGLGSFFLAAPILMLVCWIGGWLAWRVEHLFRIRAFCLLASMGAGMALTSDHINLAVLVMTGFFTCFVVIMIGVYEVMNE